MLSWIVYHVGICRDDVVCHTKPPVSSCCEMMQQRQYTYCAVRCDRCFQFTRNVFVNVVVVDYVLLEFEPSASSSLAVVWSRV